MNDKSIYWKIRKAFCNAVCPNGCPQLKCDIESGGGLVVECDKLNKFVELIDNI